MKNSLATKVCILFMLWCSSPAMAVHCAYNLPPSNPDTDYVVHNDGTVTDSRTGLMWKACSEGQAWSMGDCSGNPTTHTWAAALAIAEGAVYANHTDWRLPNIKELRSLVEECTRTPAINDSIFPNTPDAEYWTATPFITGNASWDVSFNSGNASVSQRSIGLNARLVRGGRSINIPTLTLLASGSGYGGIAAGGVNSSGNPVGGIGCRVVAGQAGNCSANFPTGTRVTVTASPAHSSMFVGWTGCENLTSDSPPKCLVTMNAAKSVVAEFAGSAPGLPSVLPNIQASAGGAVVAFTAPLDTGSDPITTYEASCQHGTDTPLSSVGASSPITVPGLQRGLIYSCKVRAQNAIGWGDYSNMEQALWSNDATQSWAVKKLSETKATASGKIGNGPPGENNWGPFEWVPGSAAVNFSLTIDDTALAIPLKVMWHMDGSALADPSLLSDGAQFGGIYENRLVHCAWHSGNTGEGTASCTYPDVATHLLYSPEDALPGKFGELIATNRGQSLGKRTPLILVHGWQGVGGMFNRDASIGPASQLAPEQVGNDATAMAHRYWANLIAFFSQPDLHSKYKLWVYKYPSYKHVTFNARQLQSLITTVPELQNRNDLILIAHSMGALVTRSLFEEHSLDHNRVAKIVLLDGVNHGSPAAIPELVDSNRAVKNLATLGANDIQWDFYDGINIEHSISVSGKTIARHVMDDLNGGGNGNTLAMVELPAGELNSALGIKGNLIPNVALKIGHAIYGGHIASASIQSCGATYTEYDPNDISQMLGYETNPFIEHSIRLGATRDFDSHFRSQINLMDSRPLPLFELPVSSLDPTGQVANRATSVVVLGGDDGCWGIRPVVLNPWLVHLNLLHKKTSHNYREKIYAYSGIEFGGTHKTHNLAKILSTANYEVAAEGVEDIGKFIGLGKGYGYLNDGPVPTTSALLDMQHPFKYWYNLLNQKGSSSLDIALLAANLSEHQVTMYPGDIADSKIGNSVFGIIRKEESQTDNVCTDPLRCYKGDGHIKHRLMGDYNHEMSKSGCYNSEPQELVAKKTDWNEDSCWRNDSRNPQNSSRIKYIEQALGALPPGGVDIDKLRWEPLYLSILRDIAPLEPAIPWIPSGTRPTISLSPSTLDFGAIKVDSQASLTVTIRNDSLLVQAPVTFISKSISGPYRVTSDTCGAMLASQTECKVTLRYLPNVTGSSRELFKVLVNSGSNEFSATAQMTGVGMPSHLNNLSLPSKTGAGAVTLGIGTASDGTTSSCELDKIRTVTLSSPLVTWAGTVPAARPAPSVRFPYDLVEFQLTGCQFGVSQKMTITLPEALPTGVNWAYWKALPNNATNSWLQFSNAINMPVEISADRRVISFTVTDGGTGDLDGVANGIIVDPSGLGIIDATPDTFTFTPSTGVAMGSTVVSNVVGVSGIDSAVPISVTGGEYSVSVDGGTTWSAYSSSLPSTIGVNDLVRVRHVASSLPVTSVTTTLTIGGVSASFVSTTATNLTYQAATPTNSGSATVTISGGGNSCSFDGTEQFISAEGSLPAGLNFPHGVLDFRLVSCTPGGTVTVEIQWPNVPVGSTHWKQVNGQWQQMQGVHVNGSTITYQVTDGGALDADGLIDGVITDPIGLAVPVTPVGAGGSAEPIPSLSKLALMLLAGMLLVIAWHSARRQVGVVSVRC